MIALYLFISVFVIAICLYIPEMLIVFYFGPRRMNSTKAKAGKKNLPMVSIILPVFNEEKLIKTKIRNMLELNYPKELFEIIIIDGNSSDGTVDIVSEFRRDGVQLIEQETRDGNTGAVKMGVSLSKGDIIVMSDAEALFDLDSIRFMVGIFEDPLIGAVSGRQVLINPTSNLVTKMEMTYGSFFEKMAKAESCMYSTLHTKGELVAFRKNVFPFDYPPAKGSIDIGIAFEAVRKGFRTVTDDKVVFHDVSPDRLRDRNRQKMQRATLVQESLLLNNDMLFNPAFKTFGKVILPSNFFVYIIFPIVFLIGLVLTPFALIDLFSYSSLITYIFLFGFLMLLLIKRPKVFIFTFIHSQIMLLVGLIRIGIIGKPKFTKQVEGTRKIASQKTA
jgi:biofilm PGA synthesis N-glycosyltransferase PgaC